MTLCAARRSPQAAEWSNVFSDVEMSSDSGALSSQALSERNLDGMDAIELDDEFGDDFWDDALTPQRSARVAADSGLRALASQPSPRVEVPMEAAPVGGELMPAQPAPP